MKIIQVSDKGGGRWKVKHYIILKRQAGMKDEK